MQVALYIFITFLYIPLILKFLFSLTRLEKLSPKISSILGKIEYFLSPLRDSFLSYIFLLLAFFFVITQPNQKILWGSLFSVFLLSQVQLFWHKKRQLQLCRWAIEWGSIEPNFFFQTYFQVLGSFFTRLPTTAQAADYSLADYRTGKPARKTLKPIFRGFWDTAMLARLAILAMKKMSREDGTNAFDLFARVWGGRFASLCQIKVQTLNAENVQIPEGKLLLVFNHKSHLDFSLNFFALGNLFHNKRHLRPRFIAAKDHFIDNPFIYSWLGIGKCIEKAGMIFINRKKGQGWLAIVEAAQKLIENDVEVALYPQGTRASAVYGEKGERKDAGYYTTFTHKYWKDPHGHLKAGGAQLILDTAMQLQNKKIPLHVLFIGIDGTAIAAAKGKSPIQTEATVTFRIGSCWKVELAEGIVLENPRGNALQNEAQKNYLAELQAIQAEIDRRLEETLNWHPRLTDQYLQDLNLRSYLHEKNVDPSLFRNFLQRADETENPLPFIILDRLYTLPFLSQKKYLEEFSSLILEEQGPTHWEKLSKTISEALLS